MKDLYLNQSASRAHTNTRKAGLLTKIQLFRGKRKFLAGGISAVKLLQSVKSLIKPLKSRAYAKFFDVHRQLDMIYAHDKVLRYRAQNVFFTISILATALTGLICLFLFSGAKFIRTDAKILLIPLLFFVAIVFLLCMRLVMGNRLNSARAIVLSVSTCCIFAAISVTGHFPKSIVNVSIFVPITLAYCLYGGRFSHIFALATPLFLAFQYYLSNRGIITFPDYSSIVTADTTRAIFLTITYIVVMLVLMNFDRLNEKYIQEAEAAVKSKSQFLANTSHEIRTPMNGIIGLAEVLKRTTELDEKQLEYVNAIHQSGRGLKAIINDILEFSKLESREITLEPKQFNLYDLVKEVRALLKINASNKGLNLFVDYPSDMPQSFYGDPNRIRQVLINLAGNSIKFTHTGFVKISHDIQPVGEYYKIRVAVTDTGIGIPEEKLDDVFQRFAQVANGKSLKHEGTGLGLGISQQIIRQMGGDMGVVSKVNEGSTFWFEIMLPLTAPQTNAALPSAVKTTSTPPKIMPDIETTLLPETELNQFAQRPIDITVSNGIDRHETPDMKKILLIGADMKTLAHYGSKLRPAGYRLFHSMDPAQLSSWLSADDFKDACTPFILIDYSMGEVEADAIIRQIRAHYQPVSIIALSRYGLGQAASSKLDYVVCTPEELLATLAPSTPLLRIAG